MYSRYNILFTIELLHEYFLNRKCKDFEIIPAEDTKALFKKIDIQGRSMENRFIALIRENEDNEPFLNTQDKKRYRNDYGKTVFRFYLKSVNPLFVNYTNIDLTPANSRKLYFSNTATTNDNGFLFLTTSISPFAADTLYLPGDLVKDNRSGKVYEAIKKYTSKKKSDVTDTDIWTPKDLLHSTTIVLNHSIGKQYMVGDIVKQLDTDNVFEAIRRHISINDSELNDPSLWASRGQGQLQYVNDNDLIDYTGSNYIFTVADSVKKAEVSILSFNYNTTSPAYDIAVKDSETLTFNNSTMAIPVSLTGLKPGKYIVKVNKETRVVYYDPVMDGGNIVGVIEIFNHLPGSNAYSLLTDDEKIRKINYSLLFSTRRVLWKYVRKDGKAQTITDTGDTAYKFNLAGNNFISSIPIPLSEGAVKTLKLEFNTSDFRLAPLPNPSIEHFSRCTQNDYDYLCSEVYLNY